MGRARDRASADLNGQEFILDADADTSISADTDDQIDIRIGGADDFAFKANKFEVQTGSNIDMNGTELILDADADSSITADTDDQIDIKVGGTDTIKIEPDAVTILGPHPDLNLQDSDDNNTGGVYYNDGRITLASDNGAQHDSSSLVLSVDGTARMTVDSGGDIDVETGDIFFSTAGKGINLGVTSNTDSNTLDDYEEGTFNMTFNVASGSITVSSSHDTLVYTKIGRNVYVSGRIQVNSISSPSGSVYLQGLPFTPAVTPEDSSPTMIFVGQDGMTGLASGGQPMVGQVYHNEARIFIYTQDQNGIANSGDHFTANSIVGFNFFYVAT